MAAPEFSTAGLWRGARDAVPLGFSILAYGLGFGLVASQALIPLVQAMAMSVAVFSGSAQLAAINLIGSAHFTITALVATILVINARYLLFGAALRPWLGQTTPLRAYGSLLLLGDANWIMVMRAIDRGEADRAYLLGSGLPLMVGWLVGTCVGVVSGGALPDPQALGLDMMLPCFAAAMMAAMVKRPANLVPVAVGGGAALIGAPLVGAGWAVILAGISGAAVAAALWRPARA